jgi:hypothetical protein
VQLRVAMFVEVPQMIIIIMVNPSAQLVNTQ